MKVALSLIFLLDIHTAASHLLDDLKGDCETM